MSFGAAIIAAVVLTFWAIGAYNRITVLRFSVGSAYAALAKAIEDRAGVFLSLVHAQLLYESDSARQAQWHRLETCLQQSVNAAAYAAHSPLNHQRVTALAVAETSLMSALRDVREGSLDLAGPLWPPEIQLGLNRCEARVMAQRETFNAFVQSYNDAIQEFPALLVARVAGFDVGKVLLD